MSRINELKKQNPFLTIDGIDIINNLVVKSKYTEMLVNLIKNDRMKEHDNNNRRNDYVYELREYGYDEEVLKNMDTAELMKLTLFMGHYIGYNNFRMFKEFVDLNERNLINQNDITKYKTFRDIELQISGLEAEKRMIQATDRKLLDVRRQTEIEDEIKKLNILGLPLARPITTANVLYLSNSNKIKCT